MLAALILRFWAGIIDGPWGDGSALAYVIRYSLSVLRVMQMIAIQLRGRKDRSGWGGVGAGGATSGGRGWCYMAPRSAEIKIGIV